MMSRIICGDNVQILHGFPTECIDLTVTSPPYDGLRTYNGYSFDFESLTRELWRVTKPGGVIVWVINDATDDKGETGTSFRQALFFKDSGFRLHDTMIWYKGFCFSSFKQRYGEAYEYMFIFSKGLPKAVNLIADRENTSAGRKKSGTQRLRDGSTAPIKPGVIHQRGPRHNVWTQPPVMSNSERTGHPAQFPESIANDHILTWSNPGDVVLDPFCGSGTTGKMALCNLRQFIGVEISREYCEIASQRIFGEEFGHSSTSARRAGTTA